MIGLRAYIEHWPPAPDGQVELAYSPEWNQDLRNRPDFWEQLPELRPPRDRAGGRRHLARRGAPKFAASAARRHPHD